MPETYKPEDDDMSTPFPIVSYSNSETSRDADLESFADLLVAGAKQGGIALTGEGGLLTGLTKKVLQKALETEMVEHLGYPKGEAPLSPENYRNGYSEKTVKTDIGEVELQVPRDREGTFEPTIIPKHRRRIDGLDGQVLNLYSKGMTTKDISDYLSEVYGTQVSRETVSKITEAVISEMKEWQSRPLDPIYPVIFIDAIVIKVRDGSVANRPVYVALGITTEGERDILGLWVGPTGGEGAKQWLAMLSDLKNRGVTDVCIVCCDGLKGLPEAITNAWPEATVQTCVVHLIRNSLRQVQHKDMKAVAADLRQIYTAPTEEAALQALDQVADIWGEKYPVLIKSWKASWAAFSPFLSFPPEVRKVIYTTNAIESLNARFRTAVRKRGHFPTEQSALKVLYLACVRKEKARPNPTNRIADWNRIYNALLLMYGDRLERR